MNIDRVYFTPPTNCPDCKTSLVYEGEYLLCKCDTCPSQQIGVIRNWISKLGVLHFGEALIETLIANDYVKSIPDLYTLKVEDLLELRFCDGRQVGESIITRALSNLHEHDKVNLPLNVFIGSLSIPLIGRSMMKFFIDAGMNSLQVLREASKDSMINVPGVGPAKADALFNGLRSNSDLIDRLIALGVSPVAESDHGNRVGKMSGKTMVMTGFRDKNLQLLFEEAGGEVKDSVNSSTTYLVAKDVNSGSSKIKSAIKNGTIVLDANSMLDILKT